MFKYFYSLEYKQIRKKCKHYNKHLIFDMSKVDTQIIKLAEKIYKRYKNQFKSFNGFKSQVGFMASELYDIGGHTPCLLNLANSIYENKKIPIYLSGINRTKDGAPKTYEKLLKIGDIFGISFDFNRKSFINSLINYYNSIINNLSEVIIVYIHPDDIISTALIYLLKKTANVKIIFFDHASHLPNLAMTLSDIIIEELNATVKTLIEKRHITNIPYRKCGLQSKKANEIIYYSNEKKLSKKLEYNIPSNALLTVSGGTSYKYFENNRSEHFEMIKRLLMTKKNLYHLAISNLFEEQIQIIENIFKDAPEARSRLILQDLTPQYDVLFQMSDLFIDSFPMSSAMTQIDLMAMKVPTVVKINKDKPELTFHEYMPVNYEFMYENVEDMERGILKLLDDEDLRKNIVKCNYQHWLNNYESNIVKEKYELIINEVMK